jgi:hypothetical protein
VGIGIDWTRIWLVITVITLIGSCATAGIARLNPRFADAYGLVTGTAGCALMLLGVGLLLLLPSLKEAGMEAIVRLLATAAALLIPSAVVALLNIALGFPH